MTRDQYVQRLLDAYRRLSEGSGKVRPADRTLAGQLYDDGVPLLLVETAFRIAVSRRQRRPHDAPPLQPIRSLRYFLPIIEEGQSLSAGYLDYLRITRLDDSRDQNG
jgi:hypothetical protein